MPFIPFPDTLDLKSQAAQVPNSRTPGTSVVYKSAIWDHSVLFGPGQPRTLAELFEQSVARHPEKPLFERLANAETNPFEAPKYSAQIVPTSYAEVQRRRDAIGSALLSLERAGRLRDPKLPADAVSPAEVTFDSVPAFGPDNRIKHGARRGWAVGVWSKNRAEWQIVDFATHAYGLVGVSYYETLGPDVAQYITNHCPVPIIFASANHIAEILKIAPACPTLRIVVTMDKLPDSQRALLSDWASTVGVELLDMGELEEWGSSDGVRCDPGPVAGVEGEHELDRDRVATISYTSGTTGNPKGVVLTNLNVTAAVISNAFGTPSELNGEDWRFFSFLPLSHIFERFLELLIIYADGTVSFSTGDTLRLLDDAQIYKPHFMAGVPRIFNRIHAAIKTQMATPGLKGALLTRAVNTKLANWHARGELHHAVYDALVFRKIRQLLGGNMVCLMSGAAPLSPDVQDMLTIAFSCDFLQGYGMTETVGTCAKAVPWDITASGTCGQLQPVNQAKLFDVPDMGYTSDDKPNPRGELCLRGFNVTKGYLHDPENTAKTIDADGWMHTGDVAEIDSVGRLKIVDRIKNVVKLSQGEYVALEKLEGMYALDPLYATLLIHGDSTRSSIIAIGVLDPVQASQLVSAVLERPIRESDIAGLESAVKDPKIKAAVLKRLVRTAKQNKLNGFETVKGVYLTLKPLSEQLLTPTLKIKRNVAAKVFKDEIDAAYNEIEGAAL